MSVELTLALNSLTLAFNLIMLLGACGAPLAAATAEALGLAKGQVVVRKIGQHAADAARLCQVYVLLTGGAAVILLLWRLPGLVHPWTKSLTALLPPVAGLLVCILLTFIYAGTWKRLKNARPVHLLMGLLAGAAGLMASTALVTWGRLLWLTPVAKVGELTLFSHVAFAPSSSMVPLLVQMGFTALAAGGSVAMGYVLARRNADDFGRDYYARALRFLAAWSMIFWLGSLAAHMWWAILEQDLLRETFTGTATGAVWGGACGVGLLTALGLLPITLSQLPVRNKAGILLCIAGGLVYLGGLAYTALSQVLVLQ